MAVIYIFIAVVLSVGIEAWSVISRHGKVVNINPIITYSIGAILFAAVLSLTRQDNFFAVVLLGVNYMACRGTIYSPALNKVRGKGWWYVDKDPDKFLGKWMLRNNVSLRLVVAASALLWLVSSFFYLTFYE